MNMAEKRFESYISYQHVQKAFGAQHVCQDFNLDIVKGETISIVGPSGVGKTVTIKMLIGLIDADAGHIFFDGLDVTTFTKDEMFLPIRKRVSMVFQWAALFDSMTVFENIAFPLKEQLKLSGTELLDRVQQKLDWVGLPNAASKMPSELSGGMKKRIGLARAIATDPEVILYDEPTTGLDPINTVRVMELIISLKERLSCTSIVVTHDIESATRLKGRAAFLYEGCVKALGSFESLREHKDPFVRGFLAGDPRLVDAMSR